MMLLLYLLAAVAIGKREGKGKGKDKGKGKEPMKMVCYGVTDEAHDNCLNYETEGECDAAENRSEGCKWGGDRVGAKHDKQKACLEKANQGPGKTCTKDSDCACGTMCMEMFGQKSCMMCKDNGIEEDCNAMPGCLWLPGQDECAIAKNECNEVTDKKMCGKMDRCMYDKKDKKCMTNYKSSCSGVRQDTHGLCHDLKTKKACMEKVKVNPLNNKKTHLCKFGFNDHEKDLDNKKACMSKEGMVGKRCENQGDCMCGSTCYDYFGKACMICKDLMVKEDCDAAKEAMNCKWVGDENGTCIRVDPCREFQDNSVACKGAKCMYDNDSGKCYTPEKKKASKKTCKKQAKKGKKNESDEDRMAKKNKCQMHEGCKWNAGKKDGMCEMRKGN